MFYFPSVNMHKLETQYVETVTKSSEVVATSAFITELFDKIKE